VGRVAQSVYRLATGWTIQWSNPGGDEIFHTCPDRPWGPPSLLYNGYRVFPGGKERPWRDADSSPPSSTVCHERVELYLYFPYRPYGLYRASVPVQGCTVLFIEDSVGGWNYHLVQVAVRHRPGFVPSFSHVYWRCCTSVISFNTYPANVENRVSS